MTSKVTIFKNIKETETPFVRDITEILDRIKDGATKNLVKTIRVTKDKAERNELKKRLPAICFSGVFTKRNDNALKEHSGIVCLDFDGYEKKKLLLEHKENLCKDPYVYSVFISPSGNGLKVLVKIPPIVENHINYFNSLQNYFESPYFDKMCKNVSRVCYESYDPLLYLNTNSNVWDTIAEPQYEQKEKDIDPPTIPISDENKIVEILIKWWEKKYPMVEGQRNQHCFVLAMAFNDYGINKSLAGYVLNRYATDDFTQTEISRTIDSAYSNSSNFGTKYYEDEEKLNQIKDKFRRGVSKKEIRNQLSETGMDSDAIESVVSTIEKEQAKKTFWEKNEKGTIKIVHFSFKKFLEDNGFYKYCPEGGKNYVFVKVTNNLIDHTSEKEIKDFILNYLLTQDDITVYNYFADQVRFFREEFLTLLSTIDIYFIADTRDSAYLYYQNCAVRITKGLIEPIDYLDLGGYVWKDHIIPRKFKICDDHICDYSLFIKNICGGEADRVKTMESTIGFMMHGYKNLSYCPAVILNDEVISDNPEGGTGKGIFMNALSQMKKLVTIDGKAFAFEKSFPYQLVSADTQILCFDDVKKHFDFERLFSVVTEGLTLEKKNRDAIKIPFSKSPKIAITTNYAIKGTGNSFERRKWEIELHQHYNRNFTPLDEFEKHFFADWNEDEWCLFDNYMTSCLQDYLTTGLVKSKFINLKIRQLSAQTSHDFIEWCGLIAGHQKNDKLRFEERLIMQDLYFDFIGEYPDYAPKAKMTISRTRFYRWLIAYGNFMCNDVDEGRDSNGRWFTMKKPKPTQTSMDL
ncbi:MAG: putative virulence protein [Prokaryotic dsDNA virus sp.]|nr:MAG: putative virulence protein [Prokaryotic dsDNA virus sp.]|tara:strand:- start:11785 stop:14193 length:2409 start_codon:yes stop_codon:yes gene_type:complete